MRLRTTGTTRHFVTSGRVASRGLQTSAPVSTGDKIGSSTLVGRRSERRRGFGVRPAELGSPDVGREQVLAGIAGGTGCVPALVPTKTG